MNHYSQVRKIIASFVICAFIMVMYASAMPLQASSVNNGEKRISASQEDNPGAVEKASSTVSRKKSPIIPIIIGVVALGGIAAVLFLVVLKSYDIRGTWSVTTNWSGDTPGHVDVVFSGDKKSGTTLATILTGTYTVDGKKVSFNFTFLTLRADYTGEFTGKDSMSGTMTNNGGDSGTWTAVRTAKAASTKNQDEETVKKTILGK